MAVDPQIVAAEVKFRTAILGGDANARKAVLKGYSGAVKAVSAGLSKRPQYAAPRWFALRC